MAAAIQRTGPGPVRCRDDEPARSGAGMTTVGCVPGVPTWSAGSPGAAGMPATDCGWRRGAAVAGSLAAGGCAADAMPGFPAAATGLARVVTRVSRDRERFGSLGAALA